MTNSGKGAIKPLCQIVDTDDTLIGYKMREEIDPKHDYYRTSALWLVNSSGDILISKRLLTKKTDPGKWGPAVAGTLEEGDTYETNIRKETSEEIGLSNVEFAVGPKLLYITPRRHFCQWFTATSDIPAHDLKPQAEEVAQVAWISKDDLLNDVKNNPDKYLAGMSGTVNLFK